MIKRQRKTLLKFVWNHKISLIAKHIKKKEGVSFPILWWEVIIIKQCLSWLPGEHTFKLLEYNQKSRTGFFNIYDQYIFYNGTEHKTRTSTKCVE